MKKLILILTLISSVTAYSKEGVGNGGNTIKSNRELIKNYIHLYGVPMVADILNEARLALKHDSPLPMKDAKAIKIFSEILKLNNIENQFIKQEISNDGRPFYREIMDDLIQINIKISGACIDKLTNKESEAAFIKKIKKIELCISLDKLEKLTDDAFFTQSGGKYHVSMQIPALILHELAHAAGSNEDDAIYIQTYVKKLFGACTIKVFAEKSYSQNERVLNRVEIPIANYAKYNTGRMLSVEREFYIIRENAKTYFDYLKNRISTSAVNTKEDFRIKINNHEGYLTFKTSEINFKSKQQSISWSGLKKLWDDNNILGERKYEAKVTGAKLEFDGIKYDIKNIFLTMDASCIER